MKLFKDLMNNDELCTDVYPMQLIADGTVYKVTGKMVTETTKIDDSKLGANASAEGEDPDAGGDPSSVSGVNVVLACKLVQQSFLKKDFLTTFKIYMKAVKTKLEANGTSEEEIKKFQDGVQTFTKKTIIPNFDEWQFYFGETSSDTGFDTMPILMDWDGEVPYLYYFKHGLIEEKV